MKYLFKLFKKEEKKSPGTKSPVYVFFAEADAEVKTKAYKKAIRGASEEQMSILSKYDKQFVQAQ